MKDGDIEHIHAMQHHHKADLELSKLEIWNGLEFQFRSDAIFDDSARAHLLWQSYYVLYCSLFSVLYVTLPQFCK